MHLSEIEKKVLRLGDIAVAIVKETLDKYAQQFFDEVMKVIPKDTGGLERSSRLSRVRKSRNTDIYGWSVRFAGKAKNGMGYNDLAYILNYYGYGRWDTSDIATIKELGFISNSVKTLKNINEEINERWQKELER